MHNLTVPGGVETLLAEHPVMGESLERRFRSETRSMVEEVIRLSTDGIRVEELTAKEIMDVTSVFAACPTAALVERYGLKFAMFCALQTYVSAYSNKILAFLSEDTDIQVELVEHARLARWRMFHNIDLRAIQAIYDVLISLKTDGFDQELFKQFLLEQEVTEGKLSERQLPNYRAELLHTEHDIGAVGYDNVWGRQLHEDDRHYDIWHDGAMALGLMYKGKPQSVVGFTPLNAEDLLIVQVQGVRPMTKDGLKGARGLCRLQDWSGTMIKYLEACAKSWGFKTIEIQSAKNNNWVGENNLSPESAHEIYDKKALQLGYAFDKGGRFFKDL